MTDTIQSIINLLQLLPHPEGGYYKETYRSEGRIENSALGDHYEGDRNYATAIYFLLTSEAFSAFHRIKQDEVWHFYDGDPLDLHIISSKGVYSKIEIGRDIKNGQVPQALVKGGCWFASNVKVGGNYSFVGCTVSPGFDFRDFEMADRATLSKEFPAHSAIIQLLTRV